MDLNDFIIVLKFNLCHKGEASADDAQFEYSGEVAGQQQGLGPLGNVLGEYHGLALVDKLNGGVVAPAI